MLTREPVLVVAVALLLAACGGGPSQGETSAVATTSTTSAAAADDSRPADAVSGCADVVDVTISGEGPFTVSATVSSPDTGWDKYADEWRISTMDGTVLGVRELAHPHVEEQPFTRSLAGVDLEPGSTVIVAARDSVAGYCGETFELSVGG